jgi:5-methylcytosine-specific restriction endonuclease McrA
MSRSHRITHPTLGVTTWSRLSRHADELRKQTGVKLCTWCLKPVPKYKRTRCGASECSENIWRSYSWPRCRGVALRAASHKCALCGKCADQVDHIVPVSLGGTGDQSNLRALCGTCHTAETNRLRTLKQDYIARTVLEGVAT